MTEALNVTHTTAHLHHQKVNSKNDTKRAKNNEVTELKILKKKQGLSIAVV